MLVGGLVQVAPQLRRLVRQLVRRHGGRGGPGHGLLAAHHVTLYMEVQVQVQVQVQYRCDRVMTSIRPRTRSITLSLQSVEFKFLIADGCSP